MAVFCIEIFNKNNGHHSLNNTHHSGPRENKNKNAADDDDDDDDGIRQELPRTPFLFRYSPRPVDGSYLCQRYTYQMLGEEALLDL